ncbi:GNAT family N-acetyltransferase [Hyunsoonleella sp. 2307UL5-6]|uniref:GNAT family N-acetyltransferase n=1 Tax=Hyunsoonleella sp. 2307UL5-6 TaxID=3384768 RepID=UPI0039BC6B71
MKLEFINIESSFYREAVAIRTKLFFDKIKNSSALIHDEFEAKGIHLVCLNLDEVVGTGRLNIENKVGTISQMAIKENFQNKGIGREILKALIEKSNKHKVTAIKLGARETAISFYEKFGFIVIGQKYPSKKTGIIHQQMELKID